MNRICLNRVGLLFLWLWPILLSGQEKVLSRQILAEKINTVGTYKIFEDRLGFIWYGSHDLLRYDGSQSKGYRALLEDSSFTSFKYVTDLLEAPNGDLMLATYQGLFLYEREINRIKPFHREKFLDPVGNISVIKRLYKDRSGRLWVGGREKLFLIEDLEAGHVREIIQLDPVFQGNRGVMDLKEGEDGLLYVATINNGLLRINKDLTVSELKPERFKIEETGFSVLDIQKGTGDTLWLGGSKGLWAFDPKKEAFSFQSLGAKEDLVRALYMDQQQSLWIATKNNLLRRGPDGRIWKVSDGSNLVIKAINYITGDRFGNIWIGGNTGIAYLDASLDRNLPFYRINSDLKSEDNYFFRVMQDSSGGLWFRMANSGLGYCAGLEQPFEILLQPSHKATIEEVKDFCTDSDGQVWVLTLSNGLYLFKDGRQPYQRIDLGDSTRTAMAMAIIFDQQDDRSLWFSSEYGLCAVDRFTYKRTWYYPKSDLPWLDHNGVRQIHQAADGTIWCVLHAKGEVILGCLNKRSGKFEVPEGISKIPELQTVYQLRQGPNGTILAATNKGMIIANSPGKKLQLIGPEEGLPMQSVKSLMPDEQGNIWVASGKKLCRYDGESFVCFRSNPEIGAFAHTSSTKIKGGLLAFGGTRGLHIFDPDKLQEKVPVPKVFLTNFKVFQKERNFEKALELVEEIQLSYQDKVFTFQFSAPQFACTSPTRYQYKLEGFDQYWVDSQGEQQVTYTNLAPGKYRFRVLASSCDGPWTEEQAGLNLKLQILPPWYRTWWAWMLWVVLATLSLVAVFRFQIRRQLAQAEVVRQRELANVKARLFTNITHEFRTPLTVIQGMTDQIQKDPKDWLNEGLGLIRRNSQQLLVLVNQLLDLSKLEANKLPLNFILGDVISFLRYLVESFSSFAEMKDIRLHFYTALSDFQMDFDPEKLQIVVSNTLSNALKFTPSGGAVYVEIKASNGYASNAGPTARQFLVFTIRDNGPGIAAADLPHIFDRFYQVDTPTTKAGAGTGIGLALVKELVEAMEGYVDVVSQTTPLSERGTTFKISLPVNRKADKAADSQHLMPAAIVAQTETTNGAVVNNEDRNLILLIEDNTDVLRYLSSFLSGDYQIVTASNGQLGIEKAFECIPDLIVSDVMMPEKNGLEVCQTLKADERTSHIPIILLTAKTDMASRLEGFSQGADAYLAKPFSREELMIRIEKLIALRKRLQEKFRQKDSSGQLSEKSVLTAEETFMAKVLAVIEANYQDEDFGMPQLCEKLHMSRSNLFRKIKALTGKPTTHLIRDIRLEKAKDLLDTSSLNISEISFQVGFSHHAYFTTLFHQKYGLTPSNYRIKHQ